MPRIVCHDRKSELFSIGRPDRPEAIVTGNIWYNCDFTAADIGDGNVPLRPRTIFRVTFRVKRHAYPVGRNFWPGAVGDFLWVSAVKVSNKDLSVGVVCDSTLPINKCRKRNAKKDRNDELLHALGALTLGKRAFLIKGFGFFPSVDMR